MIHEELDRDLEGRLRATLDEMIPKLIALVPGIDHPLASSTTQVEIEAPTADRPKRVYLRPVAIALAAAAALAGFVVIINRPAAPDAGSSDATPVATAEPNWYPLLRPQVPDRFGFLAITNSTEDSATFVAIGDDGKALEIMLAPTDLYSDPAGTSDEVGSWTETPQGWIVNTPAGLRVEVSCDIGAKGRDFPGPPNYCDMTSAGEVAFTKTEIRSIASALADAPVLEAARNPALVTPAPQDQLLDLMTTALPNQQLISDTTWGAGDRVWDFAATGQSRPDTSVRLITGVYPRPTSRLGLIGGVYGDAAALWVIDPSGLAVRISTTDTGPDSYLAMQTLAWAIADRVAGQSYPPTPTTTPLVSPSGSVTALQPTQEYWADVWDAREIVISQCMAQIGHEYQPRPNDAAGAGGSWEAWDEWHAGQVAADPTFESAFQGSDPDAQSGGCQLEAFLAVHGPGEEAYSKASGLDNQLRAELNFDLNQAAVDEWLTAHAEAIQQVWAELDEEQQTARSIIANSTN